jgi:hypothetical protein
MWLFQVTGRHGILSSVTRRIEGCRKQLALLEFRTYATVACR